METRSLTVANISGIQTRTNAAGKEIGKRVAFLQDVPAGDIRKALKEKNPALKGKELTKAVDKVLRGDAALPWMLLDATVSAARSEGFMPIVGDLNKKGTKLTLKFEKAEGAIDKETALMAAKAQLTDDELLAILTERKAQAESAKSDEKALEA